MRDDQAVLKWIRRRAEEFTAHLHESYGDDPRALALFDKLEDVQLLEDAGEKKGSWSNGKFKHSTGVLYVVPRDPRGAIRTRSSLLKTLVHELAHATRHKEPGEQAHSPQWKQTWLWFLEIATGELGWEVDIKCAECTFYGLCDQERCPKCNWLQNLCKPYAGPPGS